MKLLSPTAILFCLVSYKRYAKLKERLLNGATNLPFTCSPNSPLPNQVTIYVCLIVFVLIYLIGYFSSEEICSCKSLSVPKVIAAELFPLISFLDHLIEIRDLQC